MFTVRDVALARTERNRRSAMRRQAKRRRECQRYGCPMHAEPETVRVLPSKGPVSDKTLAAYKSAALIRKG